ncbi:MAP7 domain-containing protein 2 [Dioscorea cayenensis subsp. rotundata]|uniref:Coiled-coil domain-containing protein 86 n=1 Tax=Dioscorea cayennensis subsp. rotundata TaxID=55577 RepID=A0AB40C1F4_DIOCR|nr:MAP7 domain-containing protein 2 [Dioscorea cayenensis subsp. rotundata]
MACTLDFRYLDEGLGGQKNKRKRSESSEPQSNGGDSMELDSMSEPPPAKRAALPSLSDPEKPAFGRPTYDGVIAGKASGRKWKQARTQRASAALVSRRGKTMELRAKEKEMKRAYKERMNELKEEIRLNKVEKRKKREEREKKKQENILRTGTKLQKITNPKTLKKIAKSKQKKLLKVVPDEILDKNANKKKNNA